MDSTTARFSTARSGLETWFTGRFGTPTSIQQIAWPVVSSAEHALIAAPTGSGKSLAAFVPLFERFIAEGSRAGTRLIHVSPLKALASDMAGKLECLLAESGLADHGLSVGLRTGDTDARHRQAQLRRPPTVLLTTPESLFILLGSVGGRRMLEATEAVIVDELHALAADKRGAHLALSLERLERLTGRSVQRIGLSATASPLERLGEFLCGTGRACRIVAAETAAPPSIEIELPAHRLGPLAGPVHWQFIVDRLTELATNGQPMLIFCNTRAMVERLCATLEAGLDPARLAAHHASMGAAARSEIEARFRAGKLDVVVCSASLELGIDIGAVERVCQIGAPGAFNRLMQRAGRSGHRPGARSRVHLFPLGRTDLVEAMAVVAMSSAGQLEPTEPVAAPMDVLLQQLGAMVCSGMRSADEIHEVVTAAWPWRELDRAEFDHAVGQLCDGFVPGRDRTKALIRRRADGLELAAAEEAGWLYRINAGTIPEWFDYPVRRSPAGEEIGRLDEEFAFESSPGDHIRLGGRPLRILSVRAGQVLVEPSTESVAGLPFWFGDGAGRSAALSARVARLIGRQAILPDIAGNDQIAAFITAARQALGRLPGPECIVFERFFDPGGDQHLVIHSLHGARVNRAWGLALRKRFCRQFNFELQAAATDNAVIISLGATHSFDLPDVAAFLTAENVEAVLTQAVLDTPLFQTRFRWCASTALAILRRDRSGPVTAQLQRNQTENLIARVFPDQLACLENLSGEREVPDHVLVAQALNDCLREHMDLDRLLTLLEGMQSGRVECHFVDTAQPSVLAEEVINAPRHSFLDPAAAEERRTRSFETPSPPRRQSADLDPGDTIRRAAWRLPGGRDGLETILLNGAYLTAGEGETGRSSVGISRPDGGWLRAFRRLAEERVAVCFRPDGARQWWTVVDWLPVLRALWPRATFAPFVPASLLSDPLDDADEALCRLVLARIGLLGAASVGGLAAETGLSEPALMTALERLRGEGLLATLRQCDRLLWCLKSALAVSSPGQVPMAGSS